MDFYFLIHLASLCLLIGEFSLLIFKVIIGRYLLIAVLMVLVDAAVDTAFSGTSYCSNYALVFFLQCIAYSHSSILPQIMLPVISLGLIYWI